MRFIPGNSTQLSIYDFLSVNINNKLNKSYRIIKMDNINYCLKILEAKVEVYKLGVVILNYSDKTGIFDIDLRKIPVFRYFRYFCVTKFVVIFQVSLYL